MSVVVQSARLLLVLSLITGVGYPLLVTTVSQLFFTSQADGSLITRNGHIVGSAVLGQSFSADRYFHSRPSAINYNPMPSGGSNLGPTSQSLRDKISERSQAYPSVSLASIPGELLTASGSGLDPHLSPEGARVQIERVVAARNGSGEMTDSLQSLITSTTEPPQWGILGMPRVKILRLNMALDSLYP